MRSERLDSFDQPRPADHQPDRSIRTEGRQAHHQCEHQCRQALLQHTFHQQTHGDPFFRLRICCNSLTDSEGAVSRNWSLAA